jgi:predicted ABC-type sugar transport system permease subunit
MEGRELPWFSALVWWQKVLVALLLFVVLVTVLLLPRSVAGNWIVSAAAIGQALIFLPLKWWQTLLLVAVLSAMLTALLHDAARSPKWSGRGGSSCCRTGRRTRLEGCEATVTTNSFGCLMVRRVPGTLFGTCPPGRTRTGQSVPVPTR